MKDFLIYLELDSYHGWVLFIVKDLFFSAIVATVAIFVKDWIVARIKVSKIVAFLLDKNHATREAHKGRHMADRLLDIYNNGKSIPLVSCDRVYEKQFWSSIWNESVIDKMLGARGLVETFEENDRRHVRLSGDKITQKVVHRLLKLVKKGKL